MSTSYDDFVAMTPRKPGETDWELLTRYYYYLHTCGELGAKSDPGVVDDFLMRANGVHASDSDATILAKFMEYLQSTNCLVNPEDYDDAWDVTLMDGLDDEESVAYKCDLDDDCESCQ